MKYFFVIPLLFINILAIAFYSCSNESNTSTKSTIPNSKHKFAFIKSNEIDGSIHSEPQGFGDLYVYNFEDSTTYRLTDDEYFDIELAWSPDGNRLLFASSRDKKYSFSDPDFTIFPDLYIYNLADDSEQKIKMFNKNRQKFFFISGLFWAQEGIYVGDDKSIFLFNESGQIINEILNLDSTFHISSYVITKDRKHFILNCSKYINYTTDYLGVFNLGDSSFTWFPEMGYSLGQGKSDDSFLFMSNDSLISFTLNTSIREYIPLPALSDTMFFNSANFINENQIFFNANEDAIAKGMGIRDRRTRTYVGVYNLLSDSISFLINDNFENTCITPFFPDKNYSVINWK